MIRSEMNWHPASGLHLLTERIRLNLFLSAVLCVTAFHPRLAAQPASEPTKMKWFDDAKFGMFIHWGIYSVPAGEWKGKTNYAEWIMLQGNIPSGDYGQFAAKFNPVKFDARAWVRSAKNAGMRYLVITAKHHDGFCMYDTRLTDYNVVRASPWHHDPMRDLAQACREAGIVFCFYYSVPDWHHPDFPARYSQRGFHGDPNPAANLENYVAYLKGQVRELLSQYGPIGILWFDGGGSFRNSDQPRAQLIHAQEIIDEIHALQPQCLVNNRLGVRGDYGTPEQKIPGAKQPDAFEVCMTLNRHWGYNQFDNQWKSAPVVISNLVDIASKGGNYLLNIGPTSEGLFPPQAVEILSAVGNWMKINGEAIYGTAASPLDAAPAWGRITQKKDRLYLHVFNWPADGKLTIADLPGSPARAWLLATREPLAFERKGGGLSIAVGPPPPDKTDSVIVLETVSPKPQGARVERRP